MLIIVNRNTTNAFIFAKRVFNKQENIFGRKIPLKLQIYVVLHLQVSYDIYNFYNIHIIINGQMYFMNVT